MKQKTYLKVSGLIFTVVAIFHLLRLVLGIGWDINVAGWNVPGWFSLVGLAVAGYLAYAAYKLMK